MSLRRHTFYNLAGQVVPLLLTVATVPVYIRVVGLERYGILAICWTLVSFVSFLSLGIGPALTRELATLSRSSNSEQSDVLWTGIWLSLMLALISFLVLTIVGDIYFRSTAVASGELKAEAIAAMPLIAATFSLSIVSSALSGALQGVERFGTLNLINLSSGVGLSVLPLSAAVTLGPTLPVLVAATLVANGITFALMVLGCTTALSLGTPKLPSAEQILSLLRFGGWMTLTTMLAPLVMLVDRFAVGALSGPDAVSIYVIAYNIVSRLTLIPAALQSAMLPKVAASSQNVSQKLLSESLAGLLGVLTPLSVAASALIAPFLHLWVGEHIAMAATPVAAILIAGFWVHGVGHVASAVLMGRGRPDVISKLLLAYVLPYGIILYVCLSTFGLVGVALAWTLRACCDLVLFRFTNAKRPQMLLIASGGVLTAAASSIPLLFDWTTAPYWACYSVVGIACVLWIKRILPDTLRDLKSFFRWASLNK